VDPIQEIIEKEEADPIEIEADQKIIIEEEIAPDHMTIKDQNQNQNQSLSLDLGPEISLRIGQTPKKNVKGKLTREADRNLHLDPREKGVLRMNKIDIFCYSHNLIRTELLLYIWI